MTLRKILGVKFFFCMRKFRKTLDIIWQPELFHVFCEYYQLLTLHEYNGISIIVVFHEFYKMPFLNPYQRLTFMKNPWK